MITFRKMKELTGNEVNSFFVGTKKWQRRKAVIPIGYIFGIVVFVSSMKLTANFLFRKPEGL